MKRYHFNTLAACAWIGLVLLASVYWDTLQTFCDNNLATLGRLAFPTFITSAIILGLTVQILLAEAYAPKEVVLEKDLPEEERRERAIQEAILAIKRGAVAEAIAIYERAELLNQALKLAQDSGDKASLARLSWRLGLHSRAFHLYAQLGDFEAAANISLLMDKIETAREYYKKAAEACKGKVPENTEAELWERAGDRAMAASLFEKAGNLERAAECYHILGERKNANRCAQQAEAIQAFEEKQRGETRALREQRVAREQAKAAILAKEMKTKGDLLGAGIMYRKTGNMLEAAMAFEQFQEWERAAEAYDKADLKDRAELARMHIEPKKPTEEEAAAAAAGAAVIPAPAMVMPAAFEPLIRTRAVPVYLGVTGIPPSSPEVRMDVCRRVRRGNFLEAAEFAKAAGDWVMAAAYYEHAGNQLAAADIYRQIGDINAAAWCLEKAGRSRDAAFLILGIGQKERAVKTLLNAIESGKDVQENGLALVELLTQWGKYSQALDLLQRKILPGGVSPANAQIYFQLGCLFEEQKAWKEAQVLYRHLLAAGAQSEDLTEREARVTAKLADAQLWEAEAKLAPVSAEPDNIDSMLLAALPAEPPKGLEELLLEVPRKTAAFQFIPKLETSAEAAGDTVMVGHKTLLLPLQQISLFGRTVGDPKPTYSLDSDGDLLIETPGEGPEERADPFRTGRRYRVKSELGRGGMGVVYEAMDTVLHRRVALKLIQKKAANPDAYEQFLIEARAVALLSHPNVVIIYDIGLMDLEHYIAMEFVDGGSLGSLIKREKVLPFKEALRLFIEVSRGLQAAHEAGIVHRDIKPENVLLTKKGQAKITDFGLAKMGQTTRDGREKAALEISGTPGFMAPELIRGDEPHPCFDIYALGITLFTMLVGKPPHEIANKTSFLDIVEFQKSGEHIPIQRFRLNAPEAFEQVYQYCTAADPQERYQSVEAFLPAVEQLHSTM